MKVIKVKFISDNRFTYKTDEDVKVNDLVWGEVYDKDTKETYSKLCIVTDILTEQEGKQQIEELGKKNIKLKNVWREKK
jgi:hypothetical protein